MVINIRIVGFNNVYELSYILRSTKIGILSHLFLSLFLSLSLSLSLIYILLSFIHLLYKLFQLHFNIISLLQYRHGEKYLINDLNQTTEKSCAKRCDLSF